MEENNKKNINKKFVFIGIISGILIIITFILLIWFYFISFYNETNLSNNKIIEQPGIKKIRVTKLQFKDLWSNPLRNFPINIWGNVVSTDDNGSIDVSYIKHDNIGIQSGNHDWVIEDDFCENGDSLDCRCGTFTFNQSRDDIICGGILGHILDLTSGGDTKTIFLRVIIPALLEEQYYNKDLYYSLVASAYKANTEPLSSDYFFNNYYNISFLFPSGWTKNIKKDYYSKNIDIEIKDPYITQNKILVRTFDDELELEKFICKNDCSVSGAVISEKSIKNKKITDVNYEFSIIYEGQKYRIYYIVKKDDIIAFILPPYLIIKEQPESYNIEEVYDNFLNSIDAQNKMGKGKTEGIIVVKDVNNNLLKNFPIKITSPEMHSIVNTDNNGKIVININSDDYFYLESGNPDWRIKDDFCNDLFDIDCRYSYQNFINNLKYKAIMQSSDFKEWGMGHRIKWSSNSKEIILEPINIPDSEYYIGFSQTSL